ncbi:MAG: hypothetical protein LH614_14575 [Pyrinomonadaceae bacterium]|nr:hypothetical protein [Pyrinomonadaceae bacterium]
MATNTDKPVGPGTFSRDGYSVTIAEDGKILVKKDDWLSKYSWALYRDYNALEVFVRGNPDIKSANEEIKGIKEITDVDLIETGEYLIHVPTYFKWMEKRGGTLPPTKPKPKEETTPGNTRSERWMAANLGGLDGTFIVGTAGAIMLTFRNLDVNKDFYFVLLRGGGGFGFDMGDLKGIKNLLRAMGSAIFAYKTATTTFVPVTTYFPFSAKSLEGYDITCLNWEFNTGVGGGTNISYDKITGGTPRFDYFKVVFEESNWIELPGVAGSITGGTLIWVW